MKNVNLDYLIEDGVISSYSLVELGGHGSRSHYTTRTHQRLTLRFPSGEELTIESRSSGEEDSVLEIY